MPLSDLTAGQSRVFNYAKGAFSRGLSAGASLASLVSMGQGIRKTDYLELFRIFRGETEAAYHIRNIRKDYHPDINRIPLAKTTIKSKYSFDVRIGWSGEYDEHGKPIGRYVTVTSSEPLTPREIEYEADLYVLEGDENFSGAPAEYEEPVIIAARRKR